MKLQDPRAAVTFVVRVVGDDAAARTSVASALLEAPVATDEDMARLRVLAGDEQPEIACEAVVVVARGAGAAEAARPHVEAWREKARTVIVADDERELEEIRASLLRTAIEAVEPSVERARRAKRPYVTAIIAGAAVAAAGEGLLPGAAAFVLATQIGAIVAIYHLYTGKWLARTQALAMIPAFTAEAAGGSLFLLAKSFLPPTGIADVMAGAVAASMTIAMLGAVAWALEQGYSLEEKEQLKLAFRRMRARTRAERAAIARERSRWTDKDFWRDVVRRVVFG
jgi:hypothetical protein